MNEEVYRNAVALLTQKPEYLEIAERIIEAEERILKEAEEYAKENGLKLILDPLAKPRGTGEYAPLGWEWYDVAVPPVKLRPFITSRVVVVTYRSRSATHYRVLDLEALKKAVETIKLEFAEPVEKEVLDVDEVMKKLDEALEPIIGYDDVKKMVKVAVKVGLLAAKGLIEPRDLIHICLDGPPATAKSLVILCLAQALPRARFFSGAGASKAGIQEFVIKEEPLFLLIDEADKLRREDQSALLSLMAFGIASRMKYGKTELKRLPIVVFATTNDFNKLCNELRS